MNYYIHVLRRLNEIFRKQLLLKVYKSYVQFKLDYGLSNWGCTTKGNLDQVQIIKLQKNFVNVASYIKSSMLWNDLPDILKKSSAFDVFKATIVSSLCDKSLSIYRYLHLSIYTSTSVDFLYYILE